MSQYILNLLITYRYLILFPLACFEGPLISLAVGFLVYLGYFSFFPAYGLLIMGDVIPDALYYYIGRFGNSTKLMAKYAASSNLFSRHLKLLEKLWHEHTGKTMFLSKLAYGLSTPLLVSAGLVKLPFRRFFGNALIVTLLQYGIVLTLGYYLGHSYKLAEKYISSFAVLVAIVLVIFLTAYYLISIYARKQINKLDRE